MKKTYLFLVLFFVFILVNGQNNKLSMGINSSLDFYSVMFDEPLFFNHQYETTASFSSGINIQYNVNEKAFLQSGIVYSKKVYKLVYKWVAVDPAFLDPVLPLNSQLKMSSVNLPLMIGYYLKKEGKVRFSIAQGINNEILFQKSGTTVFGGAVEREKEVINQKPLSFLSSVQLNFGAEYHAGKRLFFSLTPYFRYGFNKIRNASMNFNSVSYGGIFSLNFKILNKTYE